MRSLRFGVVTFALEAREPLSVGDPLRLSVTERIARASAEQRPEEVAVTIPFAQDPEGRAVIRGTSVIGVLRSHLAAYVLVPEIVLSMRVIDSRDPGSRWSRPATLADLLCGSEPEELQSGTTEPSSGGQTNLRNPPALRPSALRLVHAGLRSTQIDTGPTRTAVSRERGSAVPHKLFRRARVHSAVIDVVLQLDLPILGAQLAAWGFGDPGAGGAALDDLVTAIAGWRPYLGGAVGTGAGEMSVGRLRRGLADPLSVNRLLTAGTTVDLIRSVAVHSAGAGTLNLSREPARSDLWRLDLPLVCVDPLLIAPRAAPAPGRDNCAVTSSIVPGSTWRGLFRSRAEFILRSCGLTICRSSEGTCGECPTCDLFGWMPGSDDPPDRRGAQGLIRFCDSPVNGECMDYTHGPIDRFTGGAADGKLFERTSWRPGSTVTATLQQISPLRPVPEWARCLLVLVARDLHDGLIGVGNSTTRGYGTVALVEPGALPSVPEGWLESVRDGGARNSSGASA